MKRWRGKKTARNARINRDLKSEAIRLGLPLVCELRFPDICQITFGLTWAHSKRRPLWQNESDEKSCCIACVPCHTAAQNKGNSENERIILAAIAKRKTAFVEAP